MLACEYDAVYHVLTAPQIAGRTRPFIGPDDFNFAGLEREADTMSGGEALLVRVAHELWLAERRVGLWELVRRLDTPGFVRVLEALRIGRQSHNGNAAPFDLAA